MITDVLGYETLKVFGKARNFNEWLYHQIESDCRGAILEIGSGIGNLSKFLLKNSFSVTLSDLRPEYVRFLKERFKYDQRVEDIAHFDLVNPEFEGNNSNLLRRFDTIVALNVIEHIELDEIAIMNCRRMLKSGGRLIILVPAFQSLYNSLDHELGHHRRYSKDQLYKLLSINNFKVSKIKYFNCPAIFGWWFFGTLLKRKIVTEPQMNLYNKVTPVLRLLDWPLNHLLGLSIIAVGEI
jgi:SAM-dependent methyltransferase